MANDRRTLPDGGPRETGASDPYLGVLAHQSHIAAEEGPTVAPDSAVGLNGADRCSDTGVCYDPYLVKVARFIQPDF